MMLATAHGCLAALVLAAPQSRDGGVRISASASDSPVTPGSVVAIHVTIEHEPGFHTWPDEPVVPPELEGVRPIATTLEVVAMPDGAEVAAVEWPSPVPVVVRYTSEPVEVLSFTGTVAARLDLRLSEEQPPGRVSVELRVRYQPCEERLCYRPRTVPLTVGFSVEAIR